MKLALNYKKGYWKSLDGIRGVAVLMVFLYHCCRFGMFKNVFRLGWVGVDLFFVLSGFLITGILYDTKSDKNHYRNFIVKRARRIFPLYYLFIGLFFADVLLFHSGIFNYDAFSFLYFVTYTQNIFFSFCGWPHYDALNHLWSLAIEEQFYILWPLIIFFFKGRKIIWICIAGILISIVIRNINPAIPFAYTFTFARMDALLAGCLAAILIREESIFLQKLTLPILILCLLILLTIVFYTHNVFFANIYFIRFGYTIFDIAFACAIIVLFDTKNTGNFARSIFEAKPLIFLGRYSYGIYIYHRILFKLLFHHVETVVEKLNLIALNGVPAISLLLFSIIVLLVSYASYELFEKRFLAKKKDTTSIEVP